MTTKKTKEEKIAAFAEKSLGITLSPWQVDLLADILQAPESVNLVQSKSTKDEGLETHPIRASAHTIILDRRVMVKTAISKFVSKAIKSPHTPALTHDALDELVAIAVAEFNVSLKDIYGTGDYTQLNDHALATILRIRHDQENPA